LEKDIRVKSGDLGRVGKYFVNSETIQRSVVTAGKTRSKGGKSCRRRHKDTDLREGEVGRHSKGLDLAKGRWPMSEGHVSVS